MTPPEQNDTAAIERAGTNLATLVAQLQRTQEALQRATADLATAQATHEAFKVRVREVASEYADRHNWCDQVSEALGELGLPGVEVEYEVIATVTGTIRTTITARDPDAAMEQAAAEISISPGCSYNLHGEEFVISDVEYSWSET